MTDLYETILDEISRHDFTGNGPQWEHHSDGHLAASLARRLVEEAII